MKIGFIGVGVMGTGMVNHLLAAGFDVSIFARHPQKVQEFVNKGVNLEPSIKELAIHNDVIISIVGFPQDVEEVYLGKDGVVANANPGTVLIDMTTSSPTLAKKIALEAKSKGLVSLDAPVTGGDKGAKEGTLTIFVGGEKAMYQKCLPIFQAMGKEIAYVGEAGMGQHAKLANQIAIAGAISAVAETIAYANKNGLDAAALVPVWASGSAGSWQMKNMAPRALNGDLQPGFFIKHFIKDMKLAIAESENKGLDLKMLHTVCAMFEQYASEGNEDQGTQAIIHYYK